MGWSTTRTNYTVYQKRRVNNNPNTILIRIKKVPKDMDIIFTRGGRLVAVNRHPNRQLLKTVKNFQKLSKSSVLNIKATRLKLLENETN